MAVRRPTLDSAMQKMQTEYKQKPESFPGGRKQAMAIAYSKAGQSASPRRRMPKKK